MLRGKTSTFYIIPAFPPFSPALNPSIYSITWQESWYFLWDSVSYCPLTTLNSNHAPPPHRSPPLPGACSRCSSSLQIKELCCASLLISLLAFPGICLSGSRGTAHSQRFTQISNFHRCLLHTHFILCLKLICICQKAWEGGRNHGWMDGLNEGTNDWTDESMCSVGVTRYRVTEYSGFTNQPKGYIGYILLCNLMRCLRRMSARRCAEGS